MTPQRLAIARAVGRLRGHPTIEEIYQEARKAIPMISLNTVYKTLEALRVMGEILPLERGDEAARVETNPAPHHHAICLRCGKIVDIFDARLDAVGASSRMPGRFLPMGHRVQFYGYCWGCRATVGRGVRPDRRRARTRSPV